jgi:hypothetical protein
MPSFSKVYEIIDRSDVRFFRDPDQMTEAVVISTGY